MSQSDFIIETVSVGGNDFAADIQQAIRAAATASAGAAAPSITYAHQWQLFTAANPWVLRVRNASNDAWIPVLDIDDTDDKIRLFAKLLTMSGQILAAGGTVGAPGLAFSGDPDTGLYRVGADVLGIATAGALLAQMNADSVDIKKALILSGTITPSQITADQNDYNPTGLSSASHLRLSTDASRTLTGLAGGVTGRIASIANVGSNPLVLASESASSTAANRFLFAAGDLTLAANQTVVLRYDGTSSRWRRASEANGSAALPILHVREEQTAGSDAGGSSTSWTTREINNSVVDTITGGSIVAGNEVRLPSGTYEVDIRVPAYNSGSHKARLYNVDDAAVELVGSTAFNEAAGRAMTDSIIRGRITLAATKDLRVEHRVENATASDGFGHAFNFGEVEIYTDAIFRKVG